MSRQEVLDFVARKEKEGGRKAMWERDLNDNKRSRSARSASGQREERIKNSRRSTGVLK